jgi:peptidoglycan/LPS O-acetylase OafA/YrhL
MRQLDALTSLRFFAASAVVLYHVPFTLTQSVGWTILPDGSLGVSFFFVLSGFILRHVYRGDRLDAKRFYRKRFARIYPLHIITFIVWIALFFRGWGNPLTEKMNSGIANILLLQAFFSGPLFTLGYNAVSWSISVEAFFYAIYPLLVKRAAYAAVLLVYLASFVFMPDVARAEIDRAFPNFFYFNPIARLLEFSFGMVLHDVFTRVRLSSLPATALQAIGLGALCALVPVTRTLPDAMRNVVLLLPFGAVILGMAIDGWFERILANRVLVILGESSFALYMLHHMFFRSVDPLLIVMSKPVALGVAAGAAIVLSVIVHFSIERPLRALISDGWSAIQPQFRRAAAESASMR